jgi:hypothetical protein
MKARTLLLVGTLGAAALAATPAVEAASHGRGFSAPSAHWRSGGHGIHRGWSPYWGFYAAAPFLWGSYYWGYPAYWGPRYYGYYAYPGAPYSDNPDDYGPVMSPAPSSSPGPDEGAFAGPSEGAPTNGPLYLNYCEASKAYYPKVTSCPGGWQLRTPRY